MVGKWKREEGNKPLKILGKEYFEYMSKKNLAIVSKKEIVNGITERIDNTSNDDVTIIVTKIE